MEISLSISRIQKINKMKKEIHDLDPHYINEAMNCSSIDISTSNCEPHSGRQGSNEYICKFSDILLRSL